MHIFIVLAQNDRTISKTDKNYIFGYRICKIFSATTNIFSE